MNVVNTEQITEEEEEKEKEEVSSAKVEKIT